MATKKKKKVKLISSARNWSPRKKVTVLGVSALVLVGGFTGLSIYDTRFADAAPNAYTCGDGYKHYRTLYKGPFRLKAYRKTSTSPDTKCVFLTSTEPSYGKSKYMRVQLGSKVDAGNFKYYAGPLKSTNKAWSDKVRGKGIYGGKTYDFGTQNMVF